MFKTKHHAPIALDSELRTFDVARLANVSPRQIQWWDERKLVMPRFEGHRRLYTVNQLLEIKVIAVLKRKGLSLQRIRKILRSVQREITTCEATLFNPDSTELYLLVDGKSSYVDQRHEVLERLKTLRTAVHLVCLSDLAREIVTPKGKVIAA